jgi:hypothetical protein
MCGGSCWESWTGGKTANLWRASRFVPASLIEASFPVWKFRPETGSSNRSFAKLISLCKLSGLVSSTPATRPFRFSDCILKSTHCTSLEIQLQTTLLQVPSKSIWNYNPKWVPSTCNCGQFHLNWWANIFGCKLMSFLTRNLVRNPLKVFINRLHSQW